MFYFKYYNITSNTKWNIAKLSSSWLVQPNWVSFKSDYFYPHPPIRDSSDEAWNQQFGTLEMLDRMFRMFQGGFQ